METFDFSEKWFETHTNSWSLIFNHFKPTRVLEIGSYEGGSTTWFAKALHNISSDSVLYCVDTWQGGEEHNQQSMSDVERRFDFNCGIIARQFPIKIIKIKQKSYLGLSKLLTNEGLEEFFDLVLVDGSHQSHDVLFDLCLSFKLLRVGGVLILDDYVWRHRSGILHEPKLAIDSFTNIFRDKLSFIVDLPLRQISLIKIAS
jgi:predicted O-methyltransferase YrrM